MRALTIDRSRPPSRDHKLKRELRVAGKWSPTGVRRGASTIEQQIANPILIPLGFVV
jgi:hypothetical protein